VAKARSSFVDKVLGRIGRLDQEGLQTVVQRLARERAFLETLFNAIEDGLLVVDEKGRVLYLNQAVTRLLGLQPDEAEGQPISRLLPNLDWPAISRLDHGGGAGTVRHEFEVSYPRPRYLRLYAAPLDGEAGGSSGVALILHDATEARQKTSEAVESERVHALTLLAASLAHEIGNPLNALHIHLQLFERELKRLRFLCAAGNSAPSGRSRTKAAAVDFALDAGQIAEKLDHYLGVAKGEITRLDYIITEFLQALRPSPLQLRLASLNDVARQTLELLKPELLNRGLEVKESYARHLPETRCDPSQLKQVLVNLIKNAMQAMTRRGTLTVATGATPDAVWISIADTGTGIPSEKLTRIFEPFYTTKKKGTGLGLMIVQRIIRDHGGRIELESHVGRGTTFRVWLPLSEREPRLLAAASSAA
jgi:PAS domain S-box-containing protein